MPHRNEPGRKKRNWLYIISPCIPASALGLAFFIWSNVDIKYFGTWRHAVIRFSFNFSVMSMVAELIVKQFFKKKALYVWIVEILILLIIYLLSLSFAG